MDLDHIALLAAFAPAEDSLGTAGGLPMACPRMFRGVNPGARGEGAVPTDALFGPTFRGENDWRRPDRVRGGSGGIPSARALSTAALLLLLTLLLPLVLLVPPSLWPLGVRGRLLGVMSRNAKEKRFCVGVVATGEEGGSTSLVPPPPASPPLTTPLSVLRP